MLSELPLTWLGWKQLVLAVVASLITGGGIVSFINTWLNRRKPAAETAEITIRTRVTEGDAVVRWMLRLEDAQANIDRLRSERDSWQSEYDRVFVERNELLKQNGLLEVENKSYAGQIETMRGTLKTNHLNYDNTQSLLIQTETE